MRARLSARRHLLLLVAVPACSTSRLEAGLNPDGAESVDLVPDRSSDKPVVAIVDPAQHDSGAAKDVSAIHDTAATDLSLPCQSIAAVAYDSGISAFPLDWQSAQAPSAWCGEYLNNPSTGLCFCQTSDGYREAEITYDIGGEMGIVDRTFFLYDPTSGLFVEELHARTPFAELECWIGTPGGPANPAVDPYGCCALGMPLQPVCVPTRLDGGLVD